MKNKLKRALCAALCATMAVPTAAALTACDKKDGGNTLVMTYLTMPSAHYEDIAEIENALNGMVSDKIGANIKLYPLSILEQNKYSTLIAGGTQIDLMCIAFADPVQYSSVGLIKKLSADDLNNMPGVKSLVDDGYQLYVQDAEANTIGISTLEYQSAIGGSYVVRESDLEAVGLKDTYPDQTRITYDDLDIIFAKLKEQFPTSYPCGMLADVSGYFIPVDSIGAGSKKASGVLNLTADVTSTEVVNYYETDEFKDFVGKIGEWSSKNYTLPDAAVTEENPFTLFTNGKTRGTFIDCWASLRDEWSNRAGEKVVQLQIADPIVIPVTGAQSTSWCVGGRSNMTAAALKMIDLMMTDSNVVNMLQWGIKDKHYKVLDEEAKCIDFADGVDGTTSGWYNTLGLYGDKRMVYGMKAAGQTLEEFKETRVLDLEKAEKAKERTTPAVGFVYDSSEQKTKIATVENVIDQYLKTVTLEGKSYETFITALKAAGIQDLVNDKQAQLDAYLAKK